MENERFYGYDVLDAEERLRNAVLSVMELMKIVCGDKAKNLAGAVSTGLMHKAFDLINAVDRELEQRQFKADFGYYILHECKSLKEAKRYFAREMADTSENSKLKPNADFERWRKEIDSRRSSYGE